MSMMSPTAEIDDPFALIPLSLLRAGERGRVSLVHGAGGVVQRLRELGLRGGAVVEMIRAGSPCILRLDGQKICVRSDEMAGVLVQAGAGADLA
jgi:ferrous iron transport protein A